MEGQLIKLAGALFAALGLGAAVIAPISVAQSERILRVAESTLGEADPQKPTDFPGAILMVNLYDYLVFPKPGGGLEPSLAKSWTISPDGLTYTFVLRDDVSFHDGTKFSAKDVVFTIKRMQTLKRGVAFLFASVKNVEAVDPTTVKFELSQPFSPFVAALARLAILDADLVTKNFKPEGNFGENGDYGQAFLSSTDAGSGPYRLVKHVAQQESVLQRFDNYFQGSKPLQPDTVRLEFGNDPTVIRALMARHELELTRPALPAEVLVGLSKMPGMALGLDRQPLMFQFKLNMGKPPTDDIQFRKAIALGFDYDTLYSLLDIAGIKAGTPSRGPIPSGALGYDTSAPLMKRDLAAAKEALAKSKYKPDEYALDLVWTKEVPQEEKYALLFQQNMADLGIKVNIQPLPWAQLQQTAVSNQATAQVACVFVGLATPDVDSLLWSEYHSSAFGTYNTMGWVKSDEADHLLEQGRLVSDLAARADIYRKLATLVSGMYPALFAYDSAVVEARQDYVHAPTLQDASMSVPMLAGNFQYRLMEITK